MLDYCRAQNVDPEQVTVIAQMTVLVHKAYAGTSCVLHLVADKTYCMKIVFKNPYRRQ